MNLYTEEEYNDILDRLITLHNNGFTIEEISKKMRISEMMVDYYIKKETNDKK